MATIRKATMPTATRLGRKSDVPSDAELNGMSVTRPGSDGDAFTVSAVNSKGEPRTARQVQSAIWARAKVAGVSLRAVGYRDGEPVAADAPADEIIVFRVG